ncbi:protein-disulfide reductase DsbD domain-containing protein [Sediminibacterium sp.]|uniref:protein-disulfide reductase DsbD domain-containing protein n=1 Tax=Sediminibacterium sp. TaxID=1917865 RepID=UPI002734E37D|nr:protein-disulfide reductase DsbD domain-containing protein [Sediminibacterium sp.]MDP3567523.1 protein-disulfide reductase DsbD family protein [Sediminibacterium sp.]
MKKIFAITICLFYFLGVNAQDQNPITWVASYKSISATEGEIIITPKIEKGWHTYSQKVTADGPVPTSFKFTESKQYALVGKTEENNVHEEFDKAFDAKIFVVTDKSGFKQKIKVSKPGLTVAIKIEFMCCNDMMCLPPKTIDLTVKTQ